MRKDNITIYLVVGVVAYEGDIVLFAFKDRKAAERKLVNLESMEDKFIYSHYEIQPIELIETSSMN